MLISKAGAECIIHDTSNGFTSMSSIPIAQDVKKYGVLFTFHFLLIACGGNLFNTENVL